MKRLIIMSFILFVMNMAVSMVSACSGYNPYLISQIPTADIVVEARIIQVDDRGLNAILEVENYWQGSGERYIVINRYPVALEVVSHVRGYDTGCAYNGGGVAHEVGTRGYFALRAKPDGTYSDGASYYSEASSFLIRNGQIDYMTEDWESQIITVEEFETLLTDLTENEIPLATVDADSSVFPLMRPILIETENGTHYRMNVDRQIVELTPGNRDTVTSPDGSHIAVPVAEGGFSLTAPYLSTYSEEDYHAPTAKGDYARFSPDSNYLLTWESDNLNIYRFDNFRGGNYGMLMTLNFVSETSLNLLNPENLNPLWSANSSTIAYQTPEGIWHWNFVMMVEPQLIVRNESYLSTDTLTGADNPDLLDISFTGRYIRYGTRIKWELLDTARGEVIPQAIVTPDESDILHINSSDLDINTELVAPCRAAMNKTCPLSINTLPEVREVIWMSNDDYAVLSCNEETCHYRVRSVSRSVQDWYQNREANLASLIIDFDYDALFQATLFLRENNIIQIGYDFAAEHWDLSAELDSPIINIEWGAPIFYIKD